LCLCLAHHVVPALLLEELFETNGGVYRRTLRVADPQDNADKADGS
jgi:hypothetical protein